MRTGSESRAERRGWRRFALAAVAVAAFLLPAAAEAGPPVHRALPGDPIDGFALNKACGAATDSSGDIYVASAGNDAVEVFDPSGTHLATIPNANEPCGLAVDSDGDLYVVETDVLATGTSRVVRYTPSVYPLPPSPSWGDPVPIDSSGQAKGIAVDPTDDRLYVGRGDRVVTYGDDGGRGIDELQRVFLFAQGGTYTLSFGGQTTDPIAFDASAAEVDAALEGLSTVGAGNVSVGDISVSGESRTVPVAFVGALGATDVEQLTADGAGLTRPDGGAGASADTAEEGFDGLIGEGGDLAAATGVAAYTYNGHRYVFAADTDEVKVFTGPTFAAARDVRSLVLSHSIDGSGAGGLAIDATPDGSLGFGASGAQLAVDRANGHLLVYDHAHTAVDEFELTGRFVAQTDHAQFADAGPTAIAVDRSGGAGDGTLLVTAGSGPAARLLAFAPFAPASRPLLPNLSFQLTDAQAVAVDSQGNLYVGAGPAVRIFSPGGAPIGSLTLERAPRDLALDLAGNLYVLDAGSTQITPVAEPKVLLYKPTVYPFGSTPSYEAPQTVTIRGDGALTLRTWRGIAVNPANGHLFVTTSNQVAEFDSAAGGSELLSNAFDRPSGSSNVDIAVDGATGEVFVSSAGALRISVLSPSRRLLRVIEPPNSGSFAGTSIALDQSSGHLVVSSASTAGRIVELEGGGAVLAEIGEFPTGFIGFEGIAVDNSGGPNDGSVYSAYFDDVTAFGPLSYGEPPIAATGNVSNLGGGQATLNGTVDPRGFVTTACRFEYTDEADFQANGFASADSVGCVESAAEIGSGASPVAVHADVSGLAAGASYRFRLVAENQFGPGEGDAVLFGPPALTAKRASGVHYTEAVLNAALNPSGLATRWRFEYGTEGPCASSPCGSTAERTLAAGASTVAVRVPRTGLAEGTTYHFRLVAENAAGSVAGPDQSFTTLAHRDQDCPNAALRTGLSAALPDCRAYELVTPADMHGLTPTDAGQRDAGDPRFNYPLVRLRGEGAGDEVAFFTDGGSLPGLDGNGEQDELRARRGAGGWETGLFGPTLAQEDGGDTQSFFARFAGMSPDVRSSFWSFDPHGGPFERVYFLRTGAGFELLGQGSLGTDPHDARGEALTRGAGHVIFSSAAQLEPGAPPQGTTAIYDRSPGGATHVVSLLPGPDGGATPAAGEHASYEGISEDGSAVAFRLGGGLDQLGGSLYVRRNHATTVKVADAPITFAGLSADGERIFYADFAAADTIVPAKLFAFDLDTQSATEIAPDSVFVNIAADGSRVYFTSKSQLDPPDGAAGADNLYLWDGTGPRFIARLDPADVQGETRLGRWIFAARADARGGWPTEASRTTPDGRVLVFQSHADLTGQNPDGFSQVYRFESSDGSLVCVSCSPGGELAAGDAVLGRQATDGHLKGLAVVPNVTDDGQAVFFESDEALLPEDGDVAVDVYEWNADGSAGCGREGGCLALISTGRQATDSLLYGMTADGRDVLIWTFERLVAGDLSSSASIYDARVNGGFPAPAASEPCVEDGCQSPAGAPPAPAVASVSFASAGNGEIARTAKVKVLKKSVRGTRLSLTVKVPGAGVIAASGRNLKGSKRRATKAGRYRLSLRLTAKARRALKRGKRMRLTLRVRFTPTGGEASQATVSLTARQPTNKARRARGGRG